jgi:hypothetical protein
MKPYTFSKNMVRIVLAIFSIVAFISCQKDIPQIFKKNGWEADKPVVFVGGYEFNGKHSVAKCWINNVGKILSDGTKDAVVTSIFIAGNDVYIAGWDGGPVYWKNFNEKSLPVKFATQKLNASAGTIYVSNNNVFIAGKDSTRAVYWKDGTEIMLNTTNAKGHYDYSTANSIFIAGNDIYVAGSHGPNAVYWENGVEVYLTNIISPGDLYGYEKANSIYVSDGNAYVVGAGYYVGAVFPMPRYWKNGNDESATLSHWNLGYYATNSIFVSHHSVYICGITTTSGSPYVSAVYWVNGDETLLSSSVINSVRTDPSSIYAKGNDVYVSGNDENYENSEYKSYAVYWKNGKEVLLTDGTVKAGATSIFLK